MWTLQAREADYKVSAVAYNEKAEKVSIDNAKIAASAERIAIEESKRAKIRERHCLSSSKSRSSWRKD